MPTRITSPSFEPDWKLNAGLFGFVSAATFWLILMYEVVPTLADVIEPIVIATFSKSLETDCAPYSVESTEMLMRRPDES
jgi:hypothetical protein